MAKSTIVYITSAVAAALTIIGLLFNAVSVGTDHWISAGSILYFGLWRACEDASTCYFIGDPESGIVLPIWWVAARGLTVLAAITSLVTVSLLAVTAIVQSPRLPIVAIIFALIAPFFLGVGLLAWVGGIEGEFKSTAFVTLTYGWSFGLGWVGVATYLFGAVTIGFQLYVHSLSSRRSQEPPPYNALQDVQTIKM